MYYEVHMNRQRYKKASLVYVSISYLPPLPISALFNRYLKPLKATRKGKKLKEEFGVTSGNRTRTLLHRRPYTNLLSANSCSLVYSPQKSRTSCFIIFITVELRFNEPLYNEVLGIQNDFHQPGQNYSKMPGYGTETRFTEIIVITNTIQTRKRKMFRDITNKRQHVTER